MLNIVKNVSKILFKRKSFILSSFIMPIALIFLFAVLYGSNSTYNISIINNDNGELGKVIEERLKNMEGVTAVVEEDKKGYEEKLIFHETEMVIKIDEDFTEKMLIGEKSEIKVESVSQSNFEITLMAMLENETKSLATLCNNIDVEDVGIDKVINTFKESKPSLERNIIEEPKVSINTSTGIIIYLIFICAGISCSFLLEDEREGTKARVLMGKISEKQYYEGLGLVFFLLTSIPAVEYYIVCKVLDYEFGFSNTILLLGLLLILVLFAVSFNIMLSSIVKKKSALNIMNSALTIPIFMLSGAFWPFELMSDSLRVVGGVLPPRWFLLAIEKLQMGEGIEVIIPMVVGVLTISILFFLLSVFFTRNKIVLIAEN